MSYIHRILGLGVLLLGISLVVFVPLALAYEAPSEGVQGQLVAYDIGMLQTTPTVTDTDVMTDVETVATPIAPTDAEEPADAQATPGVEQQAPAAQPQQGVQDTQQQAPGALPQTGGAVTPWTNVALMVVGGLILAGGLGLALARRNR